MNKLATVVGTVLACAAIAGITAGSAAAAEPASAPSIVQITSMPTQFVGNEVDVSPFVCPLDHPYLVNQAYTGSMSINGVQVQASRGDGVAILSPAVRGGGHGYVVGYGTGIASGPQMVGVTAFCTSDIHQAYTA